MTAPVITPYRSNQPPGRDGFPQLLRAEWTKFSTVRGWVIAMIAAALGVVLPIVALAAAAKNNNSIPPQPIGPAGQAVQDSFYFQHQPIGTTGSITAQVTSLTGHVVPFGPSRFRPPHPDRPQPWTKAGVIIKASTRPGSDYAAIMVTPQHGVRFQYGFAHDVAGLAGAVSATSPRWVRLTRSGDTIAGFDSVDGVHWNQVGAAAVAGLPATAQAGMFVASPTDFVATQGVASNNGTPFGTTATATFDHVTLLGGSSAASWRGDWVGRTFGTNGPVCGGADAPSCRQPTGQPGTGNAGFSVTLSGSGDIAPYVPVVDPVGLSFKGSLAALIAIITLAVLFITSEYRRGLVRTTFTASPRRGRVLVAKALVIGSVTFAAGLVGAAIAFPIAERKIEANGWLASMYPIRALTSGLGLRMVVGTAALLAVCAVFSLAAGAVMRRSAGAIATAVVALIFPLVLATVLPQTPAQWLLRLTPAAAFGLQQGNVAYPQVASTCLPYNGCYPLAPWIGFAVLCAWAAAALGVAVYFVRGRDA